MAIELVTGFAGEPHIASEDVGAYNAATMGTGSYILSGCAVTMSSTTKMHIAAGELLIQGRHVRITGTGIDLAVASGTTGYNRIDLAVIHYSKASTGVETVAVEIVKGTPTTGTATVPSTSGGSILNGDSAAYITLAQVAITGLTVGTPTRILSTFTSLAAVQDSVSQMASRRKVLSNAAAGITRTSDWVTVFSASDLASTFGITAAEIETRLIATVTNADFNASSGWYDAMFSSKEGFQVRCSTSDGTRFRATVACV